jgi:predicted nuclease of restriction endonuclease-like RecB superfamily
MKKKEVAQLIGDSFYSQEFEEGIPFYARRTNVLRDMKVKKEKEATVININKTINIPDEMMQRQKEL